MTGIPVIFFFAKFVRHGKNIQTSGNGSNYQ